MSHRTEALDTKIDSLPLPAPVIVPKGTPLREVLARMSEKAATCALVMDGEKLCGIFTGRDLVMKVLKDPPGADAKIDDFMTADPVLIPHHATVGEAVELMHERGFRNLPFLGSNEKYGLLTVRRILKYLASNFPTEVYNLPPKLHQVSKTPEGA